MLGSQAHHRELGVCLCLYCKQTKERRSVIIVVLALSSRFWFFTLEGDVSIQYTIHSRQLNSTPVLTGNRNARCASVLPTISATNPDRSKERSTRWVRKIGVHYIPKLYGWRQLVSLSSPSTSAPIHFTVNQISRWSSLSLPFLPRKWIVPYNVESCR